MPATRTIYDLEPGDGFGKAHTITAISAEQAVRKHPRKWSRVKPTPPESAAVPVDDEGDGGLASSPPFPSEGMPAAGSVENVEAQRVDDLKIITGIGPTYEQRLNANHGIFAYEALKNSNLSRLVESGDFGRETEDDIAKWIEQAAKLAAQA